MAASRAAAVVAGNAAAVADIDAKVELMSVDFTLPGHAWYGLLEGGSGADVEVTGPRLKEYVERAVEHLLLSGCECVALQRARRLRGAES